MTRRLLVGRGLSALATALIPTTLTLAVLRTHGHESGALGVVLACELVPLLVFLPVGGVLADRLRPERVILLADLVRCLAQVAIGAELVAGSGRLAVLAVLSAVSGVAIAFGMPAVPRLVAAFVPVADRLRVNARIGVVTSVSGVAAPAVAGGMAMAVGPGWAAALTGLLFAGSALTLGGIRTSGDVTPENRRTEARENRRAEAYENRGAEAYENRGAEAPDFRGAEAYENRGAEAPDFRGAEAYENRGAEAPDFRGAEAPDFRGAEAPAYRRTGASADRRTDASADRRTGASANRETAEKRFGRELAEGWREVRVRPWFLRSVLGHGVWHLTAGLFLTLGPLTAVAHLGGEGAWVLVAQAGTAGLVLGVLAAPRLPILGPISAATGTTRMRRPIVVVQVAAALYALPLAALAVPAPAWVIAGAYFAAMCGLGVLSPLWETVVAQEIPEGALGRVRSLDQLISFAARPFGLAVAVPLAALAGTTGLLLAAGALVAAANLAAIVRTPVGPPRAAPRRRSPAPGPRA
ncbi:MFS transporter [Nonomuraea roseoviolacea]|uniref:MFS family permease n=1 Tax=Nonomuraea roseoviolacea subsp. carminata TaxID=160689 RepID=A0ABT1JU90_9ACTN|nr:MFS transporter [Nonomuraea roseoviolacea]MCP2344841.1 MFS family permease [Nonomuraea roseoviolacea subsp. carminata]